MNKLKKTALVSAMILLHYGIAAQQFPVVSQYMQTPTFFNPGATGSGEQSHVQMLHRTQWAGYETYDNVSSAAPQLQLFTASLRLQVQRDSIDSTGTVVRTFVKPTRHGFGAVLMRDRVATLTTMEAKAAYAYHIPLSSRSTLALGMQAGMQFQSIDYTKFNVAHPDDPKLPEQKRITDGRPALTFGLWYEHEKYYIGLAADGITGSPFEESGITPNRNWILSTGYHFSGAHDWIISPSVMVLTNSEEYLLAAGVTATLLDIFWGGISYRHEEAVSAMLGLGFLQQRRLYLNYAFDYITHNAGIKSGTSHEVMLGYRWR